MLSKVRKDITRTKKNTKSISRRNATVILAQGALAAPRRNFGTAPPGKNRLSNLLKCLDARIPRTLGLPRAVGPYTVVRTTKLHQTSAKVCLFAPFVDVSGASGAGNWYNWCGVEDVDAAGAVAGAGNTQPILMPMNGLEVACEVVPAAMTVQVMNPSPLQAAEGVFAMTRVNQQMALGGSSITYNELAARIISFQSPRLLTGGKLSLRGVKCNSYPLDMNQYAHFSTIAQDDGAPFQWAAATQPAALAPILFVQENATPQVLEFMITIEWRVRFDPGNPAVSSHSHHDTLSDEAWNGVIHAASAAGHGVEELGEAAAEAGAIFGAASMMA